MKLRYPNHADIDVNCHTTIVLENNRHWRIELVIKANEDETCSLIAQSGINTQPAELNKLQGPYQTFDQAVAARTAIVDRLFDKGFYVLTNAIPIWTLQAQKAIRQLRKTRSQNSVDARFDPSDVIFD